MPGILRAIASFATKAAKAAANKIGQFVERQTERYVERKVKNVEDKIKRAQNLQRRAERRQRDEIESQLKEQFRDISPSPSEREYASLDEYTVEQLYREQSEATKKRTRTFKDNLEKMGLPKNVLDDLQGLSNAQFYALNEFLDLGNLIDLMYVTSSSNPNDAKIKDYEMNQQAQSIEYLLNNYRKLFAEGVRVKV